MTLYERISNSITVGEIADPVYFVEYESKIDEIQEQHEWEECFIIVEKKGKQIGWVSLLGGGLETTIDSDKLCDHIMPFSPDRIMPSKTSVFEAIELIKDQWYLFCQDKNRISGVFTYGCPVNTSLQAHEDVEEGIHY